MKFLNIMDVFKSGYQYLAIATMFSISSVALAAGPELSASANHPAPAVVSVGTVKLVLGRAFIESPLRGRERAEPGVAVHVHDRIVTDSNGHVHITFDDGALVSVRPDSRLEIERYDYDSAAPERSSVKFMLEEGVTRAISGEAASSARERFRLNTPIAAIGVRGTDFVVSATESTTNAMVNEGVIIVAPYSPECSADSFGPCVANAVELSGDSLQMLALDGSTPLPRLLPASNVREPNMMRDEVRQAIAMNVSDSTAASSGEQATAMSSSEESETGIVRSTNLEVVQEAVTTPQVTSDADMLAGTEASVIAAVEFTPDSALTYPQLNSRDLLWGRFSLFGSNDIPEEMERITVSFADASLNRQPTVGNFDYSLFRRDLYKEGVQIDKTVLSFQLNSAQAFYNSTSGVMAMEVTGGALNVDLLNNRFATELNLNHEATGAVDFTAAGGLFDGGFFRSSDESQRIAGAISLDGREAAYFFERQLEEGGIQGLTLWDSQ